MPKICESITERLLKLKIGASCVINRPRLSFQTARKHAPDRAWRAQATDGGVIVTRIR